jgi:hypothetical protein
MATKPTVISDEAFRTGLSPTFVTFAVEPAPTPRTGPTRPEKAVVGVSVFSDMTTFTNCAFAVDFNDVVVYFQKTRFTIEIAFIIEMTAVRLVATSRTRALIG